MEASLRLELEAREGELELLRGNLALDEAAVAEERALVAQAAAELCARAAELRARAHRLEETVGEREAVLAQARADAARKGEEVAEAERRLALLRKKRDPAFRDWAGGLPDEVLEKVAGTLVAQTEAGWAAYLKHVHGWSEEQVQERMAERKCDGNCLFVFALVCKGWRKAQLKVGGPLRTRVESDVLLPGRVALVKWALAEGCPRRHSFTMAEVAAQYGHMEVVRWLIQEQGFPMGQYVMGMAARSGNLELVRWLRGKGCDWSVYTCQYAAASGRLAILQWLRANGCPWIAHTRDLAGSTLGYEDNLGNLVDIHGNPL